MLALVPLKEQTATRLSDKELPQLSERYKPETSPSTAPPVPPVADAPWYKRWQYWAAIGGGTAVLGVGLTLALRRGK